MFDNFPMALKTNCIEAALPIISEEGLLFNPFVVGFPSKARFTISIASSKSKGFGIYSNAPPPYESIAACISVKAVIIITGISSKLSFIYLSKSYP